MNSLNYILDADVCINNIDPLTNQTFGALINSQKEKKLPYVLAIIQDQSGPNHLYLDASNLHKHCLTDLTNPITNEKINKIYFYVITKPDNFFEYLGKLNNTSHDLYFKAAKNDPEAMLQIGLNYRHAGCSYNDGEDFSKIRKELNQDVIDQRLENAQTRYQTNICKHDLSNEEDDDFQEDVCFKWLKAAAKLGNAEAQYEVGDFYFCGAETKKNADKAFYWYQRSVEQGYPQAFLALGCCYYEATGVEYNFEEAKKWWGLALENEVVGADIAYDCYDDFVKVKQQEEKARLKEIAKEAWLEKIRNSSFTYQDPNLNLEENIKIQQLLLLAAQGQMEAQFELGVCFSNATHIEKHQEKAFKWWKLAADQGHVDAQYNLSICKTEGLGTSQNLKKAFKWCQYAALNGDAEAQFDLANLYFEGKGVEQNIISAIKFWSLAYDQGHEDAGFNLNWFEENSDSIFKSFLNRLDSDDEI